MGYFGEDAKIRDFLGTDRVCAVVDLRAIRKNLKMVSEHLPPGGKILNVIKANGYGHGARDIAAATDNLPRLWGHGVATFEEAKELRRYGIRKPILILGYVFPYCYEELFDLDIRPCVFRDDMLEELALIGQAKKKSLPIHIAVDTGMSRIGIVPEEGLSFIQKAAASKGLQVEGIFTHFARADEEDPAPTQKQLERFERLLADCREVGIRIPLVHAANSAGILAFPEAHYNLVRCGIVGYGLWPSEALRISPSPLKAALSLYSRVVYVKTVPAGTPVSYGGTYVTIRPTRIATIPVGYADGYPRSLSGTGYVLIRGKRAPILGRVCMDQLMVDVTHIPETEPDDRVTLIGRDGDERISLEDLGRLADRLHYEICTNISERVQRVYIR